MTIRQYTFCTASETGKQAGNKASQVVKQAIKQNQFRVELGTLLIMGVLG
jgi:hypothetical protein